MSRFRIVVSLVVPMVIALAVVGGYRRASAGSTPGQDAAYLDRRISLLEQRLSIIESNISRLQQQSIVPATPITPTAPATTPVQPSNNGEIAILRSEIEILKSRLKEVHCGVEHLDERTLSPAAKEAQKRGIAQSKDPCRQFPESPVTLSPIR